MESMKTCRKQAFVGKGTVVFIWTTLPYRAEWRYTIVAHKMIAMDARVILARISIFPVRPSAQEYAPLAPITKRSWMPS